MNTKKEMREREFRKEMREGHQVLRQDMRKVLHVCVPRDEAKVEVKEELQCNVVSEKDKAAREVAGAVVQLRTWQKRHG